MNNISKCTTSSEWPSHYILHCTYKPISFRPRLSCYVSLLCVPNLGQIPVRQAASGSWMKIEWCLSYKWGPCLENLGRWKEKESLLLSVAVSDLSLPPPCVPGVYVPAAAGIRPGTTGGGTGFFPGKGPLVTIRTNSRWQPEKAKEKKGCRI